MSDIKFNYVILFPQFIYQIIKKKKLKSGFII